VRLSRTIGIFNLYLGFSVIEKKIVQLILDSVYGQIVHHIPG
jgi:hypothetical protein